MSLYNPRTGEQFVSTNLGFSGEFYANFGFTGGIIAGGLWGLASGVDFSVVLLPRIDVPPLVGILPYIFATGMKAEEGFGEIVNWVVKATIVAAAVIYLLSALRSQLFRHQTKETVKR